jgi:hypothetical protein
VFGLNLSCDIVSSVWTSLVFCSNWGHLNTSHSLPSTSVRIHHTISCTRVQMWAQKMTILAELSLCFFSVLPVNFDIMFQIKPHPFPYLSLPIYYLLTPKLFRAISYSSIRHLQPLRVWAASFWRFRDHTQGHTTVGRPPLDEWSARRRDLYLTSTQHSQKTNIHAFGGIRIRNPSRRVAADPLLRPLGHWDRHSVLYGVIKWKRLNIK